MCLKIYQSNLVKVISASGLAQQAALKNPEEKIKLLTDIGMLLMVEKRISGEICRRIHQYVKANNKYMKYYDKNKESSDSKCWHVNNLYGQALL